MTSSPNPSWYDVLGVDRDATPEQIKAAWRSSTDKFEPGSGSGQFRMFNDAADVLLDPARRAEYDATLAQDRAVSLAEPDPADDLGVSGVAPLAANDQSDVEVLAEPEADDVEPPTRDTEPSVPAARASRRAGIATVLLALLSVAALVAAVVLGLQVRRDSQVADARDQAPSAAERAAKAILSYDYEHLPADRKRASVYLTDGFRAKYLKNFQQLEKQKDGTPGLAVQSKTVVTSSVLGSGVMDAEADVVRVLVYVNQVSKKSGADPQIFQNRVAMTMEKTGNKWLVDDLKSY